MRRKESDTDYHFRKLLRAANRAYWWDGHTWIPGARWMFAAWAERMYAAKRDLDADYAYAELRRRMEADEE